MAKLRTKQVLAIIQARIGSTRLPGKMLLPIVDNKGALELMLERVRRARQLQKIVVATTTSPSDDRLVELCKNLGFEVFRGSKDDVLDRYYQAANSFGKPDVIVRLTGDCPLHDPAVIHKVVRFFLDSDFDYVCNTDPPTYPDGLDCEVFSFVALENAWLNAALKSEREHVTPYIRKNPAIFKKGNVKNEEDFSDKRWTLDNEEDLQFLKDVFGHLYDGGKLFSMQQVLQYLHENPAVEQLNSHIGRNEGYAKSLQQDEIIKSVHEGECDG